MFREPHQFVQRVVDDEQALAVEDNPHIAAAGAGYFLLCKTAVFDAAGHIVRLKEQAAVSYTHLDVYKRQEDSLPIYAVFKRSADINVVEYAVFRTLKTDIVIHARFNIDHVDS